MNNQDILDGAPEDGSATIFNEFDESYIKWEKPLTGIYANNDDKYGLLVWRDGFKDWDYITAAQAVRSMLSFRSLSDIREIEALKIENKTQQSYIDNALDNSKEALISRIAELEKERNNLTNDLLETENNLASLQSKFEDIETVFCDEDGRLIIEPFNGEGISNWFKAHNLEQQAKGVSDFFSYHEPRISMGKSAIWEVNNSQVEGYLAEKSKELGND